MTTKLETYAISHENSSNELIRETPNSAQETVNSQQLAILKKNFPSCFDKNGAFLPNKLAELVGTETEVSQEFYELNWLGRSYAKYLRNAPPEMLMTEDTEHNVEPFNQDSQNLLIQGDNLEVLKHLKNAYSKQVKMIYIDPPYNTGSDGFVYQDDRKFTPQQLSELANVPIEEAERILAFTAKGSNSHSAWLTFMYPRLYVARELLKDDGVIFISIDDNEQAQLKLLCDDVFGEENFLNEFIIRSNPRGSQASKFIAIEHEYIIAFAKNKTGMLKLGYKKDETDVEEYNLEDTDGVYRLLGLRQRGGAWKREDRPDMYYPIYVNKETGEVSLVKNNVYNKEVLPRRPTGEDSRWTWGKKKFDEDKNLLVGKPVNREGEEDFWDIFRKDYLYKNGEVSTKKPRSIFDETEINYQNGGNRIKELFDSSEIFKYPKPTFLLKKLETLLF